MHAPAARAGRRHLISVAPRAPATPQIPLTVCSYKDLYGWTMDEIVEKIGTKNNCTFCGVFRRQVRALAACTCALRRAAAV